MKFQTAIALVSGNLASTSISSERVENIETNQSDASQNTQVSDTLEIVESDRKFIFYFNQIV